MDFFIEKYLHISIIFRIFAVSKLRGPDEGTNGLKFEGIKGRICRY